MNQQNTPIYHIYVPASRSFLVTANYKVVENWRELQEEARAAAEAAIRARWAAHWEQVILTAIRALQAEKIEDLMPILLPPDMYYPCPKELAAKAILPRSLPQVVTPGKSLLPTATSGAVVYTTLQSS